MGDEATELREQARALFMEKRGLLEAKRKQAMEEVYEKNVAAGTEYFLELDKDSSIVKSPTGLRYTIISEGNENRPQATDTVSVEYTGTRINGEVFDSTEQRGEPMAIPLNHVVKGWSEGLQLIGEGGEIKLYIPSDLGYGKKARPGGKIQPGDTLVFDITLVKVLDVTEASELAKKVPNYVPSPPPSGPPSGPPPGPPPSRPTSMPPSPPSSPPPSSPES